VGNLERLAAPPIATAPGEPPPDPRATPELTAAFMAGVLYGTGLLPDDRLAGFPGHMVGPEVWSVPASRLMRALGSRGVKRVTRMSQRFVRRVAGGLRTAGRRG
jgi:hypothetical protein